MQLYAQSELKIFYLLLKLSNHLPHQSDALAAFLPFDLVTEQPQFSLMALEPMRNGVLDRCMRERMTPLAWSALGGGALATGTGVPAELLTIMDELAAREDVSRSSIALAFVHRC